MHGAECPLPLFPPSLFRPNVGVCIVNSKGQVFAAQRLDDVQNTWQMPQGGIDENEDPEAAAMREVTEETSIRSATIVGQVDRWLVYEFPTKVGPWDWGERYTRSRGMNNRCLSAFSIFPLSLPPSLSPSLFLPS
jgi:8-oxo-dGTP pyrophosphatase MutT (NUDIX family)